MNSPDEVSTEAWLLSARNSLGGTSLGTPSICSENIGSCPTSFLSSRLCCPTLSTRGCCPGKWLACLVRAWKLSGHNVDVLAQSHRDHLPSLLPTVFDFGPDTFRMLVDVRDFEPQNIQVEALGSALRIRIEQKDKIKSIASSTAGITACRFLERIYELPQPVVSYAMVSTIRDNTLFISVPWYVQQEQFFR